MVAINFLNYVDRWVLTGVGPLVQREFHINDFQFGLLAPAFTFVYAVGALPFGIWADRGDRRRIIGIGVAIWAFATAISGLAASYVQLFLARAVVGVGEASYYPAGTSMLSDYYEKARRSRAMGIWTGGAIVGIAVGYAGGAAVASRFGWRTAFFLTAIPGVVLAILAFNLREPVRGATEVGAVRVRPEHRASVKTALQLWRIPTLRATILSQMLLFFVLTANAYWLQFFLTRKFHVSLAVAGLYGGGGIVLGGIIGSLLGGWLGDWRSRTRPAGNIEVTIWSFVAGAVLSVGALLAPRLAITVVLFTIAVTCLSIYNGPFTAVNQNVVVPSMRASAIMMTLLIAHLGGDLFAPPIVGFLSDTLHSLQTALLIVSPAALLLAAAIAATGLKSVAGDTQAMEESWGGIPMPGVQPARA